MFDKWLRVNNGDHFWKETGGFKLCGIDFTTEHVSGVIVNQGKDFRFFDAVCYKLI